MNWLTQHWFTLTGTLQRLLRDPVSTLFTVLVIGIALSLPTGLYLLLQNVGQVAGNLATTPQITLFLALDADKHNIAALQSRLKQRTEIADIRFIPRAEALREIKQSAGLGEVVESLQHNPLPDALVLNLTNIDPAAVEKLRAELSQLPKVAHVQLDSAWIKRLDALLKFSRQAALILAVLLSFALVAITGNTIRLQILTRREEIEVSKLIGATDPFIRRPFLYFGAVQGLAGGIAAWAIVSLSTYLLNRHVTELATLYNVADYHLSGLGVADGLSLLLFSTGLGWLGGFLSVGRHLRLIEPK